MPDRIKSDRGVYYDLTKSPYVYETPYGDIFKFPSQKKLEIYTRDITKEIERLTKALARNGLVDMLPYEIIGTLYRFTYRAFYRSVVEG